MTTINQLQKPWDRYLRALCMEFWIISFVLTIFTPLLSLGADFEYIGCFADNAIRALRYDALDSNGYNPKSCFIACHEYRYFALQNGSQCFCDNDFDQCIKYGESTKCQNKRGGNWANSLYISLSHYTLSNNQSNHTYHGRNLLQIQQNAPYTLCTSIGNDNKTCYIDAMSIVEAIICDPHYPNCIINCTKYGCSGITTLHCPSTICQSCIVEPGYITQGLTIEGHNCQLLQIDSAATLQNCIINAPGNGGSLIIHTRGDSGGNPRTLPLEAPQFESNSIYSSNNGSGTADIIFHMHWTVVVKNTVIDASYVRGDLNFTCHASAGYAYCVGTNITCGGQAHCNINCMATYEWRWTGCADMTVYAMNSSVVNWQCEESILKSCNNSKITCGDPANLHYSTLEWTSGFGWYYGSADCVKNWTGIPPITCKFTTSDTCIIVRDTYSERDLVCDAAYANCQISVAGPDVHGWDSDFYFFIKCPAKLCDSCKIYCDESYACNYAVVLGYECKILEITVRSGYQDFMQIWAPANGGELLVYVPYDAYDFGSNGLDYSAINAVPGTKNMILNFEQCVSCEMNTINGTHVSDTMTVSCGLYGFCALSTIICPNDAICNIDCTANGFGCALLTVDAVEGTHDVEWICNDDGEWSCLGATLNCYIGTAHWRYTYTSNGSEWHLDGLCVDPPSRAPTAAPTIPSIAPTTAPSSAPTLLPTQPSLSPTVQPTTAPTSAPTASPLNFHQQIGIEDENTYYVILSGSVLAFVLFLSALIWCIYYYKYKPLKERKAKTITVRNACVLCIAIRDYECDENVESETMVDGYLNDLDGIEHDVENMKELFENKLNYDVFPQHCKFAWTEKELQLFLQERANYLENNIESGKCYDGLVLIISCHGVPGFLCTSDYKTYEKVAVHREFSLGHPKSRNIPRFVLFDCCSGDNEREIPDDDISLTSEGMEIGKNVQEEMDKRPQSPWLYGEANPDYMLGRVEAANHGFQSKLDSRFGSFVIAEFYAKYIQMLENEGRRFLSEIFEEIQDELHAKGKQHPEYVWNDRTGYIIFKANGDAAF